MSAPADALELFDHDVYNRTEEGFREFAESLVQNIDEVFFWRDADSVVPYFVSYAFERIFGRTCATVYGQPSSWIEAIHPDDREAALRDQLQGPTGKWKPSIALCGPMGKCGG
ncbi:MAG: PAS domain-containing protein [Acidobacteriota bacterium]